MMPVRILVLIAAVSALVVGGCRSAPTVVQDPPTGPLAELAWMSGSWVVADEDNRSEEHWTQPTSNLMLGMNMTARGGRTVEWEFLRIAVTDDGIVYLASPGGRMPATAFPLESVEGWHAVFANPEHDFPRRITYHRRGNEMDVRVEGVAGGEPRVLEWTWTRSAIDGTPR